MEKRENIRTKEMKNIVLMIIITFVIGLAGLMIYVTRDKNRYINYNEKSDIDYRVFLKQNDFYKQESLDKNKGYIASLIDYIKADFKYNIDFDEKLSYKYSYRVVAEIDVNEDQKQNSIYHYSEDLLTKGLVTHSGDLNIEESLSINYEEYNNIISRFKKVYELNNTDANLNVYLYVNIQDIDKSDSTALAEKKVSNLTIPLTIKTVSVDIGNNIITNSNNKLEISKAGNYTWILAISLAYIIISVLYIAYLFIYSSKTKTAQMIYEKEIKSIMVNYDSYIQKINGSYDIGTSQVLRIESFSDMLEIRDTLKQPILMLENKEKNGTFFIIPATNSLIYTYALRVVDIKAKMDGKEIPTYDITEIPHSEFIKKKKYTDAYIQEQITMTTSLPKIDEKNIIRGSKDKENDLYDQLEMTRSYDLREIRKAEKELKRKEALEHRYEPPEEQPKIETPEEKKEEKPEIVEEKPEVKEEQPKKEEVKKPKKKHSKKKKNKQSNTNNNNNNN